MTDEQSRRGCTELTQRETRDDTISPDAKLSHDLIVRPLPILSQASTVRLTAMSDVQAAQLQMGRVKAQKQEKEEKELTPEEIKAEQESIIAELFDK